MPPQAIFSGLCLCRPVYESCRVSETNPNQRRAIANLSPDRCSAQRICKPWFLERRLAQTKMANEDLLPRSASSGSVTPKAGMAGQKTRSAMRGRFEPVLRKWPRRPVNPSPPRSLNPKSHLSRSPPFRRRFHSGTATASTHPHTMRGRNLPRATCPNDGSAAEPIAAWARLLIRSYAPRAFKKPNQLATLASEAAEIRSTSNHTWHC